MECVSCGKEVKRKYCNKKCQRAFEAVQVETICKNCNKVFTVCRGLLSKKRFKGFCNPCRISMLPPMPSPSGPDSPTWKGGHRYWSQGRFGKDKNGLSWKVQRKQAWERDGYTCQHCHTKGRRNPDVHHIIPWRVSNSHELSNLLCLCQQCHLTEEARVAKTIWVRRFNGKSSLLHGENCRFDPGLIHQI